LNIIVQVLTAHNGKLIKVVSLGMAKLIGDIKFEGTVDGLCFYKMEGKYYVRLQSSLTGKKFWKAACFEGSRKSCQRLSRASQLAAMVYNTFRKQQGMYAALKTKAIALLKKNTREEKVVRKLLVWACKLQPVRIHSSEYIDPVRNNKQNSNTPAQLFTIPSLFVRMNDYNQYLSSA
jgi:hypothetical protein